MPERRNHLECIGNGCIACACPGSAFSPLLCQCLLVHSELDGIRSGTCAQIVHPRFQAGLPQMKCNEWCIRYLVLKSSSSREVGPRTFHA